MFLCGGRAQALLALRDAELAELLSNPDGAQLLDISPAFLTAQLFSLKAALPPAADVSQFVVSEPGLLLVTPDLGPRAQRAMRAVRLVRERTPLPRSLGKALSGAARALLRGGWCCRP